MREFDNKTLLVGDGNGKVEIVSDDGEVLASISVPAGQVPVLPYLALVPPGARLEVVDGLAVIQKPHRIGIQAYGDGSHDSGANPDYKPTASTRFEREMRLTMARLQAHESRVEAKLKALERVERVPEAPPAVEPVKPKGETAQDEKAPVEPAQPEPADE